MNEQSMLSYEKLLIGNKAWAKAQQETDTPFFNRLSGQYKPEFLWIACSDSRIKPIHNRPRKNY